MRGALGIARGEMRAAAPGMWANRRSNCKASELLRWTGGLRGVRVGEAKNPGHNRSMSVTTSNVTALRAHVDLVARLAGDVKCLQETRLGKDAQRSMAKDLYQAGWTALWGPPQPLIQPATADGITSIWNAKQGGVGVLVRRGIPARLGPVDTVVRRQLWATGRWVHAIVGYGSGGQALHVFSVYGYADSSMREENEALLHKVFEAAAELGNVPVLITGDVNVPPEESAALRGALQSGRWVDAAATFARAQGEEPPVTTKPRPKGRRLDPASGQERTRAEFEAAYGGTREWDAADAPAADAAAGNRIDIVFANAEAAEALCGCELHQDCDLPTHKPMTVTLDQAVYRQQIRAVRRPQAFPTERWPKWEEERETEAARRA
eukprot:gene19609-biopygen7999